MIKYCLFKLKKNEKPINDLNVDGWMDGCMVNPVDQAKTFITWPLLAFVHLVFVLRSTLHFNHFKP